MGCLASPHSAPRIRAPPRIRVASARHDGPQLLGSRSHPRTAAAWRSTSRSHSAARPNLFEVVACAIFEMYIHFIFLPQGRFFFDKPKYQGSDQVPAMAQAEHQALRQWNLSKRQRPNQGFMGICQPKSSEVWFAEVVTRLLMRGFASAAHLLRMPASLEPPWGPVCRRPRGAAVAAAGQRLHPLPLRDPLDQHLTPHTVPPHQATRSHTTTHSHWCTCHLHPCLRETGAKLFESEIKY